MGKARKKSDTVQRELLGKKILCIGMSGAIYQCQNPKCGVVKKKGMFVEYKTTLYCSESCIKQAEGL